MKSTREKLESLTRPLASQDLYQYVGQVLAGIPAKGQIGKEIWACSALESTFTSRC